MNEITPPTPREYRWAVSIEVAVFGSWGELLATTVFLGTTMDESPQAFALLHSMKKVREVKEDFPQWGRIHTTAQALRSDDSSIVPIDLEAI